MAKKMAGGGGGIWAGEGEGEGRGGFFAGEGGGRLRNMAPMPPFRNQPGLRVDVLIYTVNAGSEIPWRFYRLHKLVDPCDWYLKGSKRKTAAFHARGAFSPGQEQQRHFGGWSFRRSPPSSCAVSSSARRATTTTACAPPGAQAQATGRLGRRRERCRTGWRQSTASLFLFFFGGGEMGVCSLWKDFLDI